MHHLNNKEITRRFLQDLIRLIKSVLLDLEYPNVRSSFNILGNTWTISEEIITIKGEITLIMTHATTNIETLPDLEILHADKDYNNVEKTEKLKRQFQPYYDEKYTIGGNLLAEKKYEDHIYLNRSSTTQKNSNKSDVDLSTTAMKKDNEEYVYTREKGIKRANRYRTNNLQYIIRTNIDDCNKYITLSFGDPDFYALFTDNNEKSINLEDELTAEELSVLKGIKDIRRCKDGDDTKLDEEHEELRLKILDLYLDKNPKIRGHLEQEIDITKYKKGTKAYTRELRRKTARMINSLITNCDPNNLSEVENEFTKFIKRLRRTNLFEDELKYIGIIEVQEETGHFHFHMICNLSYYPQYKLQQKWGNGTVDISRIYSPKDKYYQKLSKNISQATVTQYLTNSFKDTSKDPRVKKK
ncbi:MAG: rolling circle replication-associated protein, partial [Halanaerobiales bacterium]